VSPNYSRVSRRLSRDISLYSLQSLHLPCLLYCHLHSHSITRQPHLRVTIITIRMPGMNFNVVITQLMQDWDQTISFSIIIIMLPLTLMMMKKKKDTFCKLFLLFCDWWCCCLVVVTTERERETWIAKKSYFISLAWKQQSRDWVHLNPSNFQSMVKTCNDISCTVQYSRQIDSSLLNLSFILAHSHHHLHGNNPNVCVRHLRGGNNRLLFWISQCECCCFVAVNILL
jgi:hypothetical protein